jgi:AbrB family looped-hinge helix DNA binding protein
MKKKLYGTATVGTKGQVVIPADAREELGIKTGDRLYVVGATEKGLVGFIKEEQLRQIIEHITEGLENYKNALKNVEERFED